MDYSVILFIFIFAITLTILLVSLITYFNSRSSESKNIDELILIGKPDLLLPSGFKLEGEGTIDWGDGTIEPFGIGAKVKTGNPVSYTHQYSEDIEYTIIIKGKIYYFLGFSDGFDFNPIPCSTINFKNVPNLEFFDSIMQYNVNNNIIGLEKTNISNLSIDSLNIDSLKLPESGTIEFLGITSQNNTVNVNTIENLNLQKDLNNIYLGDLNSTSLSPGLNLSSFNKLTTLFVFFDEINTSFSSLTIPDTIIDLRLKNVLTTETDSFIVNGDSGKLFNNLKSLDINNVYYFGATNLNFIANNVLENLLLNVQPNIGPDGGCMSLYIGIGSKPSIKNLILSSLSPIGCLPTIGTGLGMSNLEIMNCDNFDCSSVEFSSLDNLTTLTLNNGIGGANIITLPQHNKITEIDLTNNISLDTVQNMGTSLAQAPIVNLLNNNSSINYTDIGNDIKAVLPVLTDGTLTYTSIASSSVLESLKNSPYNWSVELNP